MKNRQKSLFIKLIIIVICAILLIITIKTTLSKYETVAEGETQIDMAFYIVNENYQTMTLKLDTMSPSNNANVYTFTVSNHDATHRTETALEYTLQIRATTNLPLTYELYMNENYNDTGATNIIAQNQLEQDEDLTYFRRISTPAETFGFNSDETNTYQLVIYFPLTYNSTEYQNIMEAIEIIVDSRQIIE